jgi:hypothetical protein
MVALLVSPAPVTGKLMVAGVTWTAAASAPVALSVTLAWLAIAADATFNVPVAAPVAAGANTTPTVQAAPAGRLAAQVFWVNANPVLTVTASCVAAKLLELLMVTVCAALDVPTAVAAKLNCAGFTFSPAAAFPAPLNGTVTGFAPRVEEEIVSPATLSPAVTGVKITWTVQLPPATSVAVQVVAPVAKLLAFAPVIWNPTLVAATPPVLVIVKVCGALTTPTFWLAKARLAGFALIVAG